MATSSSTQLVAALEGFQAGLTPEQKVKLLAQSRKPDATSVITFMTQIDNENATRRRRGVSSRLCRVLESIQGFSYIVDTCVSSHPNIAALVWGSVKFVIHAANNITSFFEKLSECFLRLGNYCPRYSEYQALFVDSTRLQKSLSDFYATVINFCAGAYRNIQNPGTTLTQALWRPYEKEFGDFESTLRKQNEEVIAEINLAGEQAADRERKAAAEYRKNQIFSRGKATKDAQERRLLKDQQKAKFERKKLLDKLSSHDYLGAMKRIRKKRHNQTSSWLSGSKAFKDWLDDANSSTLWLSGILGSGKSTVTAAVIEHLLSRPPKDQNHLSFFFCEYDNLSSLDARIILGTLIRQCLSESKMSDVIESRLKELFEGTFLDVEDLEPLLQDIAATPGTIIFVIDGFDECRKLDRMIVLKILQRLMSTSPSKIKILLSSREDVIGDIDRVFTTCHHVGMDCEETRADILTYVEDMIDDKMLNGDLEVSDPQLKQDIQKALANGANGMFLWVAFQIEELCRQKCDADIRKALQTLPRDLNETYTRILNRIVKDRNAQIVSKIFRWVAAAKRPLLLDELQEAIAIEPKDPYLRKDRLVTNVNNIISWCGSLTILQEEDSVVQFAHHSVKQFLLSDRYDMVTKSFHFQLPEINHAAGEICVTYLHFNDFERQVSCLPKQSPLFQPKDLAANTISSSQHRALRPATFDIMEQLNETLGKNNRVNSIDRLHPGYPLLAYVMQFWLSHTTEFSPESTSMWELWAGLILNEHHLAVKPWTTEPKDNAENIMDYILAENHLALMSLIEYHYDNYNFSDVDLWKLLFEASGRGNAQVVRYLIEGSSKRFPKEINLNAITEDFTYYPSERTALSAAAERGHLEVVKILLTAKANVKIPKNELSALCLAAGGGHAEMVELLLTAHVDVNPGVGYEAGVALQAAAKGGHTKIVEILLRAKADVNAVAVFGGRPALQTAAEGGHTEIVEILLKAKADVNAVTVYHGRTALQTAAGDGHTKIVEILLKAKADVNAVNVYDGRTALQAAAQGGHKDVRRLLKKAGAIR